MEFNSKSRHKLAIDVDNADGSGDSSLGSLVPDLKLDEKIEIDNEPKDENESEPHALEPVTGERQNSIVARIYQMELLQQAYKQNLIICLPTGSGKTYIAVQLAKHYFPSAFANNKKIVFTANTLPLVDQQYSYFVDNFGVSMRQNCPQDRLVRKVSGYMNVDHWNQEKWNEILSRSTIFVMTSQICKDIVEKAYLKFSNVALLILDECHNASKDHAMAKLMEMYNSCVKTKPKYEMPRVLGLTATIIKGKGRVEDIPKEVQRLEDLMCSKAVTYHNYEEVLKHSTNADIDYLTYESTPDETFFKSWACDPLETCINFLKMLPRELFESDGGDIDHPAYCHNTRFKKSKDKKLLVNFLSEVILIYETLGPYCARLAGVSKIITIQTSTSQTRIRRSLGDMMVTSLRHFIIRVEKILNFQGQCESVNKEKVLDAFVTDKLRRLRDFILQQTMEFEMSGQHLCGIVFVKTRLTAQTVSWYLQEYLKFRNIMKFSIRPTFLVGVNGLSSNDLQSIRAANKLQEKILQKFHIGEVNLIVATAVLEEGLNVPKCNLVVRFDSIDSYPSFVQSMGRARNIRSKFVVIVSREEELVEQRKCEDFCRYNKELAKFLRSHAMHLECDSDNGQYEKEANCSQLEPFCPSGREDGPMVSATSAIALVNQYCTALPGDRFVELSPISWWHKIADQTAQFQAFLLFPRNAIVKGVIEGPIVESKTKAKRGVFLEACKRLYNSGALTENLVPKQRELPQVVFSYLDTESENLRYSSKPKWYKKQKPITFCNVLKAANDTICYVIRLKPLSVDGVNGGQNSRSNATTNVFNCDKYSYCFGLLASQKSKTYFGKVISFILKEKHFDVLCTIETVKVGIPSQKVLNDIVQFQDMLYKEVLFLLNSSDVKFNSDKFPLLVCPLQKVGDGTYVLFEEILTSTQNFSSGELLIPNKKRVSDYNVVYTDSVVVPYYRPGEYTPYCVTSVLHDMTPNSPWMDKSYDSFSDYFESKYNLVIENSQQPLLESVRLANQLNFLSDKNLEQQRNGYRNSNKKHQAVVMIPELTNKHPLPLSLFVQARFLPTILHRIERILLAMEIKKSVANMFSWSPALESEEIKCVDTLSGAETSNNKAKSSMDVIERGSSDAPCGCGKMKEETGEEVTAAIISYIHPDDVTKLEIESAKQSNLVAGTGNDDEDCNTASVSVIHDDSAFEQTHFDSRADFNKEAGPSSFEVMKAITLVNGHDCVNLERLETIGDSFLKYAVSTHVYSFFCEADEGLLTRMRNKLVSNALLFQRGTEKCVGEILAGGIFIPNDTWLPPGYFVEYPDETGDCSIISTNEIAKYDDKPKHTAYDKSIVYDKCVADCAEALIGVYFLNGGCASAFRVMEWLGLKGPISHISLDSVPYGRWTPPRRSRNSENLPPLPTDLLPLLDLLQKDIDYVFNDPWLLVEAFLHPSYPCRFDLDCYQRLEYIGDAILDFLITNHIYSSKVNGKFRTPGKLTDLRSALVNNITFGSLSVRYKLHNFILYHSKELQDSINAFVLYQKAHNHKVTGHFSLVSEFDAITARDIEVPKVLGDIFESLAGAVYVDSGLSLDTTWRVFYRLLYNEIVFFSSNEYLTPVRDLYQRFPGEVKYTICESSKINANETIVEVRTPTLKCFGIGRNKTSAKQAAAKVALASLKGKKPVGRLQENFIKLSTEVEDVDSNDGGLVPGWMYSMLSC